VLGVSKTASDDEIKRAFRKLILKCHPDKGGNSEEFIKVRDSYDVLKDYMSRCRYDQTA
jgi:DnaJ-class molecular chaperone